MSKLRLFIRCTGAQERLDLIENSRADEWEQEELGTVIEIMGMENSVETREEKLTAVAERLKSDLVPGTSQKVFIDRSEEEFERTESNEDKFEQIEYRVRLMNNNLTAGMR